MTESTEHALGPQHLAGCVALSRSANWNQNEADWRLMLELGRGWGLSSPEGRLLASTLVLPYGRFAWISMVLVLPAHRRKGYATRLLRTALDHLKEDGLVPVLDATPAGREVYRQEGFRDAWTFKRLQLDQPVNIAAGSALRAIDWQSALPLDREAFGGAREKLLRALAERLPQAALAVGSEGFVLGRDGREANQIGPLVARSEDAGRRLVEAALAAVRAPLYLDVVDHRPELQRWLLEQGFVFQRPFTRMVHGAARPPGNEALVYLVAGPELG